MEVIGYSSKFCLPLGWHYLLDMIWVLKELDLKPGAIILDAGGGGGLLQYILASKGYNLISVDMGVRGVPKFVKNIFDVNIKVYAIPNGYVHGCITGITKMKEMVCHGGIGNQSINLPELER